MGRIFRWMRPFDEDDPAAASLILDFQMAIHLFFPSPSNFLERI